MSRSAKVREMEPWEKDIPLVRSGPLYPERYLLSIMVILLALALILNPSWTMWVKKENKQSPGPGDWPIYMKVSGKKTISDKDFYIRGDIIIPKGAELTFERCNITMNGTVYNYGKFGLTNSKLRDETVMWGYSFNRSSEGTLQLELNLNSSTRANLSFMTEYALPSGQFAQLDIMTGKDFYPNVMRFKGDSKGVVKQFVDLTPYCGDKATLEFIPPDANKFIRNQHFAIGNFSLKGDRTFTGKDMSENVQHWNGNVLDYDYQIQTISGEVVLSQSTLDSVCFHKDKINGTGSRIDIRDSVMDQRRVIDSGYFRYWIAGSHHNLSISKTLITSRLGLALSNSSILLVNVIYSGEQRLAYAMNSDVQVISCTILSDWGGIEVDKDSPDVPGSLVIEDTNITADISGILADNVTIKIDGCMISAMRPIVLKPVAGITRDNCTIENIADISNSLIICNQSQYPGVEIECAFEIRNLENLISCNEWNGSELIAVKTHVMSAVDLERRGYGSDDLYYMYRGKYCIRDNSMQQIAEGQLNEEWKSIDFDFVGDEYVPYVIPIQSVFYYNNMNYSFTTIDDAPYQFYKIVYEGDAYAEFYSRNISKSDDIMILNFNVPNECDISIGYGYLNYIEAERALEFKVYFDTIGRTLDLNLSICITLAGMELDYFTLGMIEGDCLHFLLTEDIIGTGGELIIALFSNSTPDPRPSDNYYMCTIRCFSGTAKFSGLVNASEIWIIKGNATFVIENCTIHPPERPMQRLEIYSWDNSSIEILNSSLKANVTIRGFATGLISNSTFLPLEYQWTDIYLRGGSWKFENVTTHWNRSEFEARLKEQYNKMHEVIAAGFISWDIWDWLIYDHHINLMISAENFTIVNTKFMGHLSASANRSLIVLDSNLVFTSARFHSDELRLYNNSIICYYSSVDFSGNEGIFTGNDYIAFGNGPSLSVTTSTITNNTITSAENWYGNSTGIQFEDKSTAALRNNTISGFGFGISYGCPNWTPSVVSENKFESIGRYVIVEERTLQLRVSERFMYELIGADFNIHTTSCAFNDACTQDRVANGNGRSFVPETGTRMDQFYIRFYSCVMGNDGEIKRVNPLHVNITVEYCPMMNYREKALSSFERDISIGDESSWFEDIM
jgi:hypothetical protein